MNPVVRVKYCNILPYFLRFLCCWWESRRTLMLYLVLWFLELDKTWDVFMEVWILSSGTQKMSCLAPGGLKSMNTRPQSCDRVQARMWCVVGTAYLGSLLLLPQGLPKLPQFPSSFCSLNKPSLFQPLGLEICHSYFLEYSSSRSFRPLCSHGWLLPITRDLTYMSPSSLHMASNVAVLVSGHPLWHFSLWFPSLNV